MHKIISLDSEPLNPATLTRLRKLVVLLDSSIPVPGTNIRMGLDPLIGLIPGFGDASSAILSGVLVLYAAKENVPTPILVKMMLNIVVDTLVGTIPILGDFFDVGWKANTRNMALLDGATRSSASRSKASTPALHRLLIAAGALIGIAVAACLAGTVGVLFLVRALP